MAALSLGRLACWRDIHCPETAWLSASEQKRLASFSSPLRRQQFLSGRWLLRELLAQVLGGEPSQQVADIDDGGRTRLVAGHANLSHSGEWLIVVHAASPIGVDLERLRSRRDLLGLARMVHSPAQCEALAALDGSARLHQFYRWWTLKEAWLKARGQGLDMARMRELDFLPCTAEEADSCSTLLPRTGVALAVHCDTVPGMSLPSSLVDEPLDWHFFRHLQSPAN